VAGKLEAAGQEEVDTQVVELVVVDAQGAGKVAILEA